MTGYILPLEKLIEQFERLPGIGHKTAVRLAFSVLEGTEEDAQSFAQALLDAKQKIVRCKVCQNISDTEVCSVCADPKRDRSMICVVEDSKAVMALERVSIEEICGTHQFSGSGPCADSGRPDR